MGGKLPNLILCEPLAHISDTKLIRTDTTPDLSQKAMKASKDIQIVDAIPCKLILVRNVRSLAYGMRIRACRISDWKEVNRTEFSSDYYTIDGHSNRELQNRANAGPNCYDVDSTTWVRDRDLGHVDNFHVAYDVFLSYNCVLNFLNDDWYKVEITSEVFYSFSAGSRWLQNGMSNGLRIRASKEEMLYGFSTLLKDLLLQNMDLALQLLRYTLDTVNIILKHACVLFQLSKTQILHLILAKRPRKVCIVMCSASPFIQSLSGLPPLQSMWD
ncbi:hypothetical protein RJ639_033971 [Escallonia herrerae]|uniref:Uncharacterized protein n=1 Tax=Escallonia herrerae TaxID=1293975 RepID=A0AA88WXA4_9ASTE|nr:hypothetical protein RJ639_033971 [Escallonia herrerae]